MGQGQAHSSVTPLAIAVLALLEERPMHPYEMFQTLIARREDKLVKVRPGSLYHTVSRLADQELVRAEGVDRAGNRPERTTYRITGRGRDALRNRIAEIVRRPVPEYPIFPVALGEMHNLPKPEALALLRERIGVLKAELADTDMLSAWAREHAVPRRYWIALPYLRAMLAAELSWVEEFTAELDSGALEWEDFDPETGAPTGSGDATESADEPSTTPPVPRGQVTNSDPSLSDSPS
ncbi:PadR family transcriptional regulator [Nocardia gipuzkoensis]|uniref:PadR family transcriptional regulator n=1 Tax=Nocardia gipuzkoensis TaxID=2749991 RepID=UPI00237EC3F5|nr:PadR family transcriptional regulator [Nocardia gipuzkoensis]MDE1675066.1 PadR family transcriptional regulator [Nocardia gipuzkoensis]